MRSRSVDRISLRTSARAAVLACLALFPTGGCKMANAWKNSTDTMATSREFSQQGLAAIEREDWAAAEASFGRAIKTCPEDPDARRYYSEALWNRGEHRAALVQLHEAIRLTPADPALHLRLAELSLELGDEAMAVSETMQALDLEPASANAWALRGKLMARQGRLTQAVADFHPALKYEPEHYEALYQIAEVHRALNQPRRALNALVQLAELYPPGSEPQDVQYLIGLAYLALKQPEDAAESLRLAASNGPESADILCRLAEAELLAGHTLAADQTVRKALALAPDHAQSLQVLQRVELAQPLSQPLRR
jgi:tetratricopeptide (TPR) repeat protein